MTFVLRTDGGARGNPGPAAAAFVLESDDGCPVTHGGRFLGETTNNVAEYEALAWGLQTALDKGVREVLVLSDSELVVKQLHGEYRVKHDGLKFLHARVTALIARFDAVTVRHVPRADNKAADALVNEAIDLRGNVGLAPQPPVAWKQDTLFR